MTRKPSKNRRRRFAERIEEARSNRGRKERQAAKDTTDIARLERRVASLRNMLRAAQAELRENDPRRAAPREAAPRTVRPRMTLAQRKREARVREIRAKIEAERDRQARIEARHQRLLAERKAQRSAFPRKPAARRPAPRKAAPKRAATQREAAPKMFRRKKDGKVYVRVD